MEIGHTVRRSLAADERASQLAGASMGAERFAQRDDMIHSTVEHILAASMGGRANRPTDTDIIYRILASIICFNGGSS